MQTKILFIIFISIVFTNSLKIFLLGGAVTQKQTDVYIAMARATGKTAKPYQCDQDWSTTTCPKVAVITSAAQNQAEGNEYYEVDQPGDMSFKTLFNIFGLSPKHVSIHVDNYQRTTDLNTADGQRNYELLRYADLIFWDGGDQIRHSRCWMHDNGTFVDMFNIIRDRALQDKVILGGTSAGTMIWSNPAYGGGSSFGHLYFSQSVGLAPKQIKDGAVNGTGLHDVRNGTSGLQYEQNGAMFHGFGFLPYLLDTHYDRRGRLGRIVPAQLQTKHDLAIGIDEPACLYYNNGIGTVYGKGGVFFTDITKATRNIKTYFSINNVLLSYLTVGDSYDFKQKIFIPSPTKHSIFIPTHKTHLDSNDILSSYQCTAVLTHLIDQTPLFNVGKTKTPKGFPHTTPTFKLTFQKDNQTKGYYCMFENIYMMSQVIVNFTYQ